MSEHEQETPWIEATPGELIEAAKWNELQQFAKADIKSTASELESKIGDVEGKLDDVDATKFGGKTPEDWETQFAAANHQHEGPSAYRRYIKRFTPDLRKVLLKHELGRFPLVDVYELLPVSNAAGFERCKLLFYYGHNDADRLGLREQVYRERVNCGIPFEQLLGELAVDYGPSDTLEDVLNDLWEAFMRDPNDELDHCRSEWVEKCCGEKRTVKELRDADQWQDLYVAIKPRKCGLGADLSLSADGSVSEQSCRVGIRHINYDTIYSEVTWFEEEGGQSLPLDLMFLLRS